jgi:hypothetical protein
MSTHLLDRDDTDHFVDAHSKADEGSYNSDSHYEEDVTLGNHDNLLNDLLKESTPIPHEESEPEDSKIEYEERIRRQRKVQSEHDREIAELEQNLKKAEEHRRNWRLRIKIQNQRDLEERERNITAEKELKLRKLRENLRKISEEREELPDRPDRPDRSGKGKGRDESHFPDRYDKPRERSDDPDPFGPEGHGDDHGDDDPFNDGLSDDETAGSLPDDRRITS